MLGRGTCHSRGPLVSKDMVRFLGRGSGQHDVCPEGWTMRSSQSLRSHARAPLQVVEVRKKEMGCASSTMNNVSSDVINQLMVKVGLLQWCLDIAMVR